MDQPEDLLELVNNDVQQLDVLMSAHPSSRAANPLQWDSAIEFWKTRIINYCKLKRTVCFTVAELFHNFEFGDKKPWCLPDVCAYLNKMGVFLDQQSMNAKFSWGSWVAKYFVWTPVCMSAGVISSIKSYIPLQPVTPIAERPHYSESFMSQLLFIPSLIEEWSASVQPKCDPTDTFEQLLTTEEILSKHLSSVDCSHSRRFILETWKSKGVVKHSVLDGIEMYKIGEAAITDQDWSLFQIKTSVRSLENKISARQKEHDELMCNVRKAVKSENKNEARRLLRQAKVIREEIDKFRNAADRLLEAKSSIDAAALSVHYINVVQTSTDQLKKMVSPKKVEEVRSALDEIDEQTALAQEIASAISTPTSGSMVDMAELEAELAGLVLSVEKPEKGATKVAQTSSVSDLPVTPVRRPPEPKKSVEREAELAS